MTGCLANLKQASISLGYYYVQIKGLWRELEHYDFIHNGKEKYIENQHIYELLHDVKLEYETVRAQVLSRDPIPPIGAVFALLQREEDRKHVMLEMDQPSPPPQERSALVINEGGIMVTVAMVTTVVDEGVVVEFRTV